MKSISLTNAVPPDIIAFADETTISTVLRNLLSNAIKYTLVNGKVVIAGTLNGNEACINVIDNGIGMSSEVLAKAFTVDRIKVIPGTGGELGSGIGLNVCHDFIMLNSGKIEIESKVDCGTTVTIWLPTAQISG